MSIWIALVWALLLAAILLRATFNYRNFPELELKSKSMMPPDCMVVIPARNEEAVISRAVESLPVDTVIVIDDHSEDRTAELAHKAGAGVLYAPELPSGAVGKAHACMIGARVLTSRWILFADADTWYEAGFLNSIIDSAEASKLDFLSIYLRPAYETFADRLLGPIAVALYFCGINPRNHPVEAFNGQCMLVRREAYEFVGGHAAVLSTANEDLKLASLSMRHRMKLSVARGFRLGHVLIRSSSFSRAGQRFTTMSPLIGTLILLGLILCALWAPIAMWMVFDGHWIAAFAAVVWPILLLSTWYDWMAIVAPIAIYAILPIIASAAVRAITGRPVEWKDRII